MPKFRVCLEETVLVDFEIEEESEERACELAEEIWLEVVAVGKDPRIKQFQVPERDVFVMEEA